MRLINSQVVYLLTSIIIASSAHTQVFYNSPRVRNVMKAIKNSVVLLDKKYAANQFSPHGTGFVLEDSTNKSIFLVTNAHVFGDYDTLYMRLNLTQQAKARVGKKSIGGPYRSPIILKKSGKRLWKTHPKNNQLAFAPDTVRRVIDIGVLEIGQLLKDPSQGDIIESADDFTFEPLPEDICDTTRDYIPTEPVFFIGFPLGLAYGIHADNPVYRSGNLAASIEDYLDLIQDDTFYQDVILADIQSFGGNSGSPVFLKPRTNYEMVTVTFPPKLIGIIGGHLPADNRISISDEHGQGRLELNYQENSGLGIIYPIEYVLDIVHQYSSIN